MEDKQTTKIKWVFMHKVFLVVILASSSCNTMPERETRFSTLEANHTGIEFINDVHISSDFNILTYRNFYNGGGVGIGDINNDGLPDVYLIKNQGDNKLYLNKGNFSFQDITASAGVAGSKMWSTGVTMADVNADGYLDIYVCNAGITNKKNELFINNGDLTFTERAGDFNLDEDGFSTHAAFFDYDGDGDLDAYIVNNSFILPTSLGFSNQREVRSEEWRVPEVFKAGGDKLLRNDEGYFVDVSEESGIYGSLIGFGLGVTVGDINEDSFLDIYISNDFFERDYLYINQGDGTFREEIKSYIQHSSLSSMGADMADLNNDQLPEIFVTDMRPDDDIRLKNNGGFETFDLHKRMQRRDFYNQFMQNTMQVNNGNGSFSETAYYSGIAETDWSWGALIFDMDNDGYKDIFVCNGIYKDITNNDFINYFANESMGRSPAYSKEQITRLMERIPSTPIPNFAFHNNQDLTFTNKAAEWGLDQATFSNGAAYGDLDLDGDLDLIVNNVNQSLLVYRNNSVQEEGNRYLKIKLSGNGSNTFGIGSKVKVYVKDQTFVQELIPSRGFQSSVDYSLVFGLGNAREIDSIQVIWPDRSIQTLPKTATNQTLEIDQSDAAIRDYPKKELAEKYMEEREHELSAHREDEYNDYNIEGTIYRMLSKEGPAVAVADINGDGLDDIYLGGAKDQAGIIYLQNEKASFLPVSNNVLESDRGYEDTAAVFTDVNGDAKPDLIVSSGGNNIFQGRETYRTRIYLNRGSGRFTKGSGSLLETVTNISVIAPHDYDQDGDVDLFIGSRSIPGQYGQNPPHYLFENQGRGVYGEVTDLTFPTAKGLGMITEAQWADMDSDGREELVVAGDWMSPKIFKYQASEGFKEIPAGLEAYTGSWSAMKIVDLNKDGSLDIILGNRGTNSFFKPQGEEAVQMYVNDFDGNGTAEQIFTRTIQGKIKPVHLRVELLKQIPPLGKKSPTFAEYASKSISDLFSDEMLGGSLVRDIRTFKSVVLYNRGNYAFEVGELPGEAQMSSIHAIETLDLNGDDRIDLIMAGNDTDLKPQFGRLDSNYGLVLMGTGDGSFATLPSEKSGFFLKGEVKSLNFLKKQDGCRLILAGINNSKPKIFKLQERGCP